MAAHGIQLGTLKDCFKFLQWLHKNDGKQQEVARELHGRISKYFQKGSKHFNLENVKKGLSDFLGHVSKFYERLCYYPRPGRYDSKQPSDIVDALLECLPKFLAAIYFLEYCVNQGFKDLGGGGWQQNWPAYDDNRWGGDLANYLYAKSGDPKYNSITGLIPGGLTSGEVKYRTLGRTYYQGYNMVDDLNAIMRKGNYNFLRSVFVTSVFSTDRGTAMQNTANSLSLVRTFCDIVLEEADQDGGGGLIKKLDAGLNSQWRSQNRSICWKDLREHCAQLREKLGTLLNKDKRFDFTGQSTALHNLHKEELASRAADWMRQKLTMVRGNLNKIKTDASATNDLGEYFTKHFFPYGFIFKERFHLSDSDVRGLKTDWRNVIDDLKKRNGSDLDRLVEILNGDGPGSCQSPPHPPKKPEAPPAKVPEAPKEVVPEKVPVPQKTEGAQNQGKNADGTTDQNNGQSEVKPPPSPVVKPPAATPSPGKDGGPGLPGPTGPATPASSPTKDTPGSHPTSPQAPVPPQIPSASGSNTGSAVDQGARQNVVQNGSQPTSQASDHGSSGGGTAPGATGPGGGGSGKDAADTCLKPTLENLWTHSNDHPPKQFCTLTYKSPVRSPIQGQKTPSQHWEAVQEKEKQRREQQEREAEELKQKEALREKHRQQEQLQNLILSVEGSNVGPPLEGKTLPDVSALISQKRREADERSKMREQIHIMRDGDFVHASAIKPFTKQPYAARLLRSPKRSKPLPAARHKHHNVAVPDVADGMALPQNLPTKMNVPRHKFKQSHKPLEVQELDDYPIAFTQHVSGTDLTKFPAKDVNATAFQDLPQPVPQLPDFNGSPIPDSNLKSSLNPTAMFLPVPHPTIGLKTDIPERPPQIEEEIDFYIDVPKSRLPDNDLEFDLDFDDDTAHIKHDALPLPADPYIPKISFNLRPPDPQQYLPTIDKPTISAVEFEDKCPVPWITQKPTHDSADIPDTELFPSLAPRTVKEMLIWMAGLQHKKHQETLQKCITNAFKRDDDEPSDLRLSLNGADISPQHVIDTIKLAAVFAGSVLSAVAPRWKMAVPSVTSTPRDSDQSNDPDCCALLCQLRDYVYACYHQLAFLKSQCSQVSTQGCWQNCEYGHDVPSNSPLQDFLTDASDSKFETHPFDPCDICLKSRVNMGFTKEDLPASHQTGKHLHTILSPTCGGEDPLLTLSSQLNCITRRTPRTAGEIVSFFHNFGNELHSSSSQLSRLGTSLTDQHNDCPRWDCLKESDADTVRDLRGSDASNSIHDHNHNHDKGHPKTLSTLLGCDITNAQCPQLLSPITYRAYALYSSSFAHHYLSWAVYLADRLWDSLLKLHCDFEKLQCHDSRAKPLHQCPEALPLLYTHGFTPPDGTLQSSLTCSKVIAKLEAVANGQPIANLMTCMDAFLYRIRAPFLYTLLTLWSVAMIFLSHTTLYRMHVLRIRSHLLTTRASHLIDVKALLAGSRRMLSLYKDVDYFDDDFHS
ncbi:Ribosome-binding protein 1 [Babesia ovata]|uniref:Ribosome-binding protein 1 n=1 Tax=Babesia ovata TaxID=189622 RepID=A0A2H6KHZ2_9APIC|nr:Ribosome-binding protein 1 [Babesia ovata]GBE62603.1 Ribosome-binding protein 1 [Babesia ovata]